MPSNRKTQDKQEIELRIWTDGQGDRAYKVKDAPRQIFEPSGWQEEGEHQEKTRQDTKRADLNS